jgi:hypothetical protein
MLSTVANVAKYAQNYLKLSKIVQNCLEKIGLRNSEIPPKWRFWCFSKKKTSMYREGTKAYVHRLDFQYNNFPYGFFIVKKWSLYLNFIIPLCAK